MTRVYIIRHAEAEGNIYRRIHGHYDSLLTELGRLQLLALEKRFEKDHIDAVYSSDLLRAAQTAAAIAGPRNLTLRTTSELREVNMGIWEDQCWGEIEETHPEQLGYFNTSPEKWNIVGGEDYFHLQSRMVSEVLRIAAGHEGGTVVVVTHGTAIRALQAYILNIEPFNISSVRFCDNTAVTALNINEGKITLEYINDNSHLPEELSSFRKETWWKEKDFSDKRNMRFMPMDLNTEGKLYLACYKDAWIEAHGTYSGFTKIYLQWAKERSLADPNYVAKAILGNRICGIIELAGESDNGDNSGHIAFLYLTPEFRGKGLAIQLLGYAVWYYRKLGRRKLTLKVAEENYRARSFYKKYGFYPIGSENGALGKLIIMEKDIFKQ